MVNRKKQALIVVSGVLILAIALGVSAVFAQVESQPASQVAAQPVFQDDDDTQDEPESGEPEDADKARPQAPFAGRGDFARRGGFHGRGFSGQLEGLTPMEELVAESLGVTVEQLQEAHTQVFEALREESDGDFRGRRGLADRDEVNLLLAAALSDISGKEISVEALEAAHEAAREAMLEQLPEELRPSEEQLALMEARQALAEAIDREAIFLEAAEKLGLDPAALAEARENPRSLFTLVEEAGLTMQDFMDAQLAAFENAVQGAVPETITQEQADLILEGAPGAGGFGHRGFDHHGGRGGCHGRGGPGGFGPGNGNAPTTGVSL